MMFSKHRAFLCGTVVTLALTVGSSSIATGDHVAVNRQPGFNTAEAAELVHTESAKPAIIAAQLRLGSAYVRLGESRLAANQLQDGPDGWFEPAYLGYKLISIAHHGLELSEEKAKKIAVPDPTLRWQSTNIAEARQHLRLGIEYVNHLKADESGAPEYIIRELGLGVALVRRVLIVMP
jgi:hypothetical protein